MVLAGMLPYLEIADESAFFKGSTRQFEPRKLIHSPLTPNRALMLKHLRKVFFHPFDARISEIRKSQKAFELLSRDPNSIPAMAPTLNRAQERYCPMLTSCTFS